MKWTFVRLSRAKSVNCWLRSGEKSSISKGSRPTCIRVIANCKIDFGRHVFTALHFRTNKANWLERIRVHLVRRPVNCSPLLEKNLTTIFQIQTSTAVRLFEQTFHLLRSRDQIVHFGDLALRERL